MLGKERKKQIERKPEASGQHQDYTLKAIQRDGGLIRAHASAAMKVKDREIAMLRAENNGLRAKLTGLTEMLHKQETQETLMKVMRDEIRLLREELFDTDQRSLTDPLTGLGNRRKFDEDIHSALALHSRGKVNAAVILIDMDKFKEINDTLGHVYGDAALKEVAKAITSSIREEDRAYRFGGDEFAVLANLGKNVIAEEVIDIIISRIEFHAGSTVVEGNGHSARLWISAGYAIASDKLIGIRRHIVNDDVTALLDEADRMLYAVKNDKKSRRN